MKPNLIWKVCLGWGKYSSDARSPFLLNKYAQGSTNNSWRPWAPRWWNFASCVMTAKGRAINFPCSWGQKSSIYAGKVWFLPPGKHPELIGSKMLAWNYRFPWNTGNTNILSELPVKERSLWTLCLSLPGIPSSTCFVIHCWKACFRHVYRNIKGIHLRKSLIINALHFV